MSRLAGDNLGLVSFCLAFYAQELSKNFTPSMAEVQAAFKIFQLTPEEKGGREGERGEGWSQFDNKNNKPRKHHPPEKDVGGRTAAGKRFELQWHHEQAGIIPNSCPQQTALRYDAYHGHKNRGQIHEREVCNGEDPWGQEKTDGLYWQLYKSLAAFRMAERRETEEGE